MIPVINMTTTNAEVSATSPALSPIRREQLVALAASHAIPAMYEQTRRGQASSMFQEFLQDPIAEMGGRGTQNWNVRAAGRLGTSGFAEFRTPGQRLTDRVVGVTVFRRRLCRSSRCKLACRACGRSCAFCGAALARPGVELPAKLSILFYRWVGGHFQCDAKRQWSRADTQDRTGLFHIVG